MKPRDLDRYATPSDPQIHPNGESVAFVVTQMDFEEDRYVRRIHVWNGDRARPFTAGPFDSSPRWSPDGATLAFIRKEEQDGAVAQLAVMPFDGGEAEILTDFGLGVTEIAWAPDGGSVAVVGVEYRAEYADLDDDERARVPKRITELPSRFDGLGELFDKRSGLFVVDVGSKSVERLTADTYDVGDIKWRPDGNAIAFVSARHATKSLDPGAQVWEIDVSGGEPTAMTDVCFGPSPSYRPDGVLHVAMVPDADGWPDLPAVKRRSATGEWEDVTPGYDRSLFPISPKIAPSGPQWLTDGSFVSVVEDRGSVGAAKFLTDGSVVDLVGGNQAVSGVTTRPDGSAMVFTASTIDNPGEVYWFEAGRSTALTDFNSDFADSVSIVEPEHFTVPFEGGEVDVWVYLPKGEDRVPTLLNIHGGPASQYGWGFFDEFQVYAEAGYGVVACNPRGSSGAGRDHLRAVIGTWQREDPPDVIDVTAALDEALDRFPRLDRERIGIMGGSYGGFMTARMAARDDRYRSAVAERGVYSWTSFTGSSDIGQWFPNGYLGTSLIADPEAVWKASPLAEATQITTPTLIIHSENDYRTPIEQGEQLFGVLMANGVTTELLRFPGEGHEMSRGGSPKHRRERFEAILEWHGRHL